MNQEETKRKEQFQDCLGCKLTGAAGMTGLGYAAWSQRTMMTGASRHFFSVLGIGVARLFGPLPWTRRDDSDD
ncbi:hypothetical protein PROFUN_13972 [Planoprotostelium fungivorum]|uniref:DUF4536 domain-containing protein n=1 Tax=Planoprotostelium fungivorum TaxID=1890364 RepID=A0A2P6N2N6_9EUKA|nr:hypothetical protein PROFUN_13972 [Planoprotostelium fungivorum]